MTRMRQPTKAELNRLRSDVLRLARNQARARPAMATPPPAVAGGIQDCYDATVAQLGYDPLAAVEAYDTPWGAGWSPLGYTTDDGTPSA